MNDFIAGTMGGFAGKLLDYPLDTVKVLLQTQNRNINGGPTYNSTLDCIIKTYKLKGISGFYTGITSPLLGSMCENALLFASYGYFQSIIKREKEDNLSWLSLSLCGACSGAIVPLVLTPVELIKCRLQIQSSENNIKKYKGPIDCVIKTINKEGFIKGLYRGNVSTMLREIPGNFCWYGTYEGICLMNIPDGGKKEDCSTIVHIFGGGLAGAMYWTSFYPADTVKSRIQTSKKQNESFITVFNNIYKKEGIKGLYRGWTITIIRAVPAHAAIFTIYEKVNNQLNLNL